MLKNLIQKGKWRLLSVIFGSIALASILVITVLSLTVSPNKDDNKSNLDSTTTTYDQAYFDALLETNKQIDTTLFKYTVYNTAADAPDGKTAGRWFTGIDMTSSYWNSVSFAQYLTQHPSLVIPESYATGDKVVGVDLRNQPMKNYTIYHFIKAIVIPDSVKYVTTGSLNSFANLEYLKMPFVGTSRGSSGTGMNYSLAQVMQNGGKTKPTSDCFASMFGEPFDINVALTGAWSTDKSTNFWLKWDGVGAYNAGNVSSIEAFDHYQQRDISDLTPTEKANAKLYEVLWAEISNQSPTFQYLIPRSLQWIIVTDDTKIGNNAFTGCTARHIEIPDFKSSSFAFGKMAFSECQELKEVILPTKMNVSFGEGTFNTCQSLEKLILPPALESIPTSFLYQAINLKELYMPASIKEINDGAFKDCQSLEKIVLYSGNSSAGITGDYEADLAAGQVLRSSYDFNFPAALTKIGKNAFENCQNLYDLSIPESVTSIGYSAFGGCTKLKKMVIPFVGAHSGNCTDKCQTDNMGARTEYHGLFGWLFGQQGGKEDFYSAEQSYSGGSFTFQIPNTLTDVTVRKETVLSTGCLQGLKSVVNLTINPEVGSNIATGCMNGMANLQSLQISSVGSHLGNLFYGAEFDGSLATSGSARVPGTLTTVSITNQPDVSGAVFHNCTKLENVEIGKNTRYMGSSIFYNNQNLTSLTIPFTGCERGEFYRPWWWWRDKAWRNSVQWLFSSTPHTGTYENNTFRYYDSYIRYIPQTLKSLTVTDETIIGTYSFRNFRSLESISITNLPSSIEEYSFYGCSGLQELTIPYIGHDLNKNGNAGSSHVLGYIFGHDAYGGSYGAYQYNTTFYIPNNLKSVKVGAPGRAEANMSNKVFDHAFAGCSSLTSVDFYDAYINILGNNAFANCVNLSRVNYPNASFTHAGNYAFYNCQKVQAIEDFTPDTLRTLGAYSFAGTSIGFKDPKHEIHLENFDSIGSYAFANCLQIEKVSLPARLGSNIGDGIFSGCQYLSDVNLEANKHVTKYMFQNCTSLEGIDFTGIFSIPEGIFSGCVNLLWDTEANHGFVYDESTSYIGPYAFKNCRSLEDFKFTQTLKTIDRGAFQGCTGIEYMTIPRETTTINPEGWIGCNDNFFFYVYEPEENWSKGWVNNWNCDYPVYVLGSIDDDVYTYVYDQTERKFYITGLTPNANLSGIITIPTTHNGIQVVGIDESRVTQEDADAGAKPIKSQVGISKVILPRSVTKIVGDPFATGARVDIYTELTRAEVTAIYNNSSATLEAEYIEWLKKNPLATDTEKENRRVNIFSKVKGWKPFEANPIDGVCYAVDGENSWDQRYWTSGGVLYYKDYWQYGTGVTYNVPYLKINTFKYTLSQHDNHYTSGPIIQNLVRVQLPGELFENEGLGIESNIMFIEDFYTTVFTTAYSNNVNVGTATINVGVDNDALREYNRQLAEETFDTEHPLLFTGTTVLHYTIAKSLIEVHAVSGFLVEKEYDGEVYSYNTWLSSQILGLEGFTNAVFTGTLRTPSANAGLYASNTLIWSTPWKVTLRGADISNNFELVVTYMVKITPMDVEIVWTKYNQPINGVYQLVDVDPNPYTDDNGTKLPLVYYPYIGGNIQPYAVAKKINGGTYVPNCTIVTAHQDPSQVGTYPYGANGTYGTYLIYAYISPSQANNYKLKARNEDGSLYTPTVVLGPSNVIEGVRAAYRVTKGLINITFDTTYTIGPKEDYWAHTWGVDPKAKPTDPDHPNNDRTYMVGLGANSRFVGTLATSGDAKLPYTLDSNTSGHLFNETAESYLTWKDVSFYYQNGSFVVNYTASAAKPFCIYNPTLGLSDETEYYDVVVNGRIQIEYNKFNLTYFIGVDDQDYDFLRNPDYIVHPTTMEEVNDGNIRYYEFVQYEVDGQWYKLSVEDWTAYMNNYPEYKVRYYKDDGSSFGDDYPTFQEINEYVFAVQISGRHFDTELKNIRIKTVKSNVRVGDLSKVYDREPVNPVEDGKILKIGQDQLLNLTFTYYDARGNELSEAPANVGNYSVRIYAPEGQYFNEYNELHYFEISKRRLNITISGSKVFDRDPYTFTPLTTDLVRTDENPDEGLLPGDEFTGMVQTSDFIPGIYSSDRTGTFSFIWSPKWTIYYDVDNSIVSDNYLLVFTAEYEILPLEFRYNATGYEGDYDGNFHTGTVDVLYPSGADYYPAFTPDYEVFYSTSSLSANSSGWLEKAPVFADPGEYKLYYMIRAEYFKTVIDYVTIKINPLIIVYEDPATLDTDGQDDYWTVQYTSMSHTYEINVLSPKFSAVVYYSLDGSNWTTEAPLFIDYGEYDVYYRIEAPYHETVGPVHRIVRIKINLDDEDPEGTGKEFEDTDYTISFFRGEYDGQPHSLEAAFTNPDAFDWTNILYSVDNRKTWTKEKPSYTELGKYLVSVKFAAAGYKDLVIQGYIEITGMLLDVEPVPYEGVFDGEYHMVGLRAKTGTLRYDADAKIYYYDNGRGTGEVALKFSYTTNPNLTNGTSGWLPTVAVVDGVAQVRGFKDVGTYAVYVMLEAENFETEIFDEYTTLTITKLLNPAISMDSPQLFMYSKAPLDGSKIVIDTVADGARAYYYYSAYKVGAEYKYDEPMNRINPPQELGVYYVEIRVAASKNCGPCSVTGYIEIVPRVLEIQYTNPQYYDGTLKTPEAYVETGTSDIIHVITSVQGNRQPIEVGTYIFDVFMVENNPNYVLASNTIEMEIRKRNVLFALEEEHLLKDAYEPWVETDSEYYDKSAQCGDNKWHLLGDLSGTRTVYIDGEEKTVTYSGLANNHILYAELETNKGVRGSYFYSTISNEFYINRVQVKDFNIYQGDANGNYVLDDNDEKISVLEYYDVDYDLLITLVNPDVDLDDVLILDEYDYDGLAHTIQISLPGYLNGGFVRYENNGNYGSVPPKYINVGEYKINYMVGANGFEDTYGTATLKIRPAELSILVGDMYKVGDETKTKHDIYDDTPHINPYELKNILSSPMPKATHMKYYDASVYTYDEILKLYQAFDAESEIYADGLDRLVEAGNYFCVVYYAEDVLRWKTSYAIVNVELKPRDIFITIHETNDYVKTYDGTKISIPLTNAEIDTTNTATSGLVLGHTLDTSANAKKFYTVQTNSADAGVYDLKTQFEFGAIDIRTSSGKMVNSKNYHPVILGNFHVEILKAYLRDGDFTVEDYKEKVYDGYRHEPDYTCISDGELIIKYYDYDGETGNKTPLLGDQKNAGLYLLEVSVGEGKNYHSLFDSYSTFDADGNRYFSKEFLEAKILCHKLEVEVQWEAEEQTFTGSKLDIKPYIIDNETDHENATRVDLLPKYWDNVNFDWVDTVINAGNYLTLAGFDTTTLAGQTYDRNYTLTNTDSLFTILMLELRIQLGDGGASNTITYYNTQTPWRTNLFKTNTAGAAEILSDTDFIKNWIPTITISSLADESQPAYVVAKDYRPGTYKGDQFDISCVIRNKDGVEITDSINFEIIGTVIVKSDEIDFEVKDVTLPYKEVKNSSVIGYTFNELQCLTVKNPKSGYTVSGFEVNGVSYGAQFPNLSQAGEYEIDFDVIAPGYTAVRGHVNVTITQFPAYMTFNRNLGKVYDGSPVDVSKLIATSASGFNGSVSDLVFTYTEFVYDNGTYNEVQLDSAPTDVGRYKVHIVSSKDEPDATNLNYTTLDVTQEFSITAKQVNLVIDEDKEIMNDESLGKPWDSGLIQLNSGKNPGISSGDLLQYQITTDSFERGEFTASQILKYIEGSDKHNGSSVKTFTTESGKQFTIAWRFVQTDDKGNIIYNEVINPDYNPTDSSTGDETIQMVVDQSKNYLINLTFKMKVHYPYIPVEIEGYEGVYDGEEHSGTIEFSDYTSADNKYSFSADWFRTNATQMYARSQQNIDNGIDVYSDINDFKFADPGSYTIYYKIMVGPGVADIKFEPYIGSYVIQIDRLERTVTTEPMGKEYDTLPAGVIKGGTIDRYFPDFTVTHADENIPDDYTIDQIEIVYKQAGSTTAISSEEGCIRSGAYVYTMRIPQTKYYKESVVQENFVISKVKIYIEDAAIGGPVYAYDGWVKNVPVTENTTRYQIGTRTDKDAPLDLLANQGLTFNATLVTRGNHIGTYKGIDDTLTLLNYEFTVVDLTGEDVSVNYLVDIKGATITIDPIDIQYKINHPEHIYDNQFHEFSFLVSNPSDMSLVTVEWFDDFTGQWTTTPIKKRDVGEYKVTIRLSSSNYKSVELELPMTIVRAQTVIEYVSSLNRVYDGNEVTMPEIIKTNRDQAGEGNIKDRYTYKYYGKDDQGNFLPQPMYTQYYDEDKGQVIGSGDRPVNVGEYRIVIEIPESKNFAAASYSQDFVISGCVTSITWENVEFVYDGTPKQPNAYLQLVPLDKLNGNAIKIVMDISVTPNPGTGNMEHTNKGTYTATASINTAASDLKAANYVIDEASKNVTFVIQARPTQITLNYPQAAYIGNVDYVMHYNKLGKPGYSFKASNLVDTHTIKDYLKLNFDGARVYNQASDFTWLDSISNAPISPQTPRIYNENSVDVTSNYLISCSYLFVLDEAITENSVSINNYDGTYDGNYHTFDVELLADNPENFTFEYWVIGRSTSWSTQKPRRKDVGQDQISVRIKDPKGEVVFEGTAGIIIRKADPVVQLEDVNLRLGKEYDGTPIQNPKFTYNGTTATNVIYTYYKVNEDGTTTQIYSRPVNAGKYRLGAEIPATENYNKVVYETTDFEITKRQINIHISPETKSYDSLSWTHKVLESEVERLVLGHKLRLDDTSNNGILMSATPDVGEYTTLGDAGLHWQNSFLRIYDAAGNEVNSPNQENYVVNLSAEVNIVPRNFDVDFKNQTVLYDGQMKTMAAKINGTKMDDGTVDPRIYADFENEVLIEYALYENGSWNYSPAQFVQKAGIGTYPVRVRISAPNYETIVKEARLAILDPNNPILPPDIDPDNPGYDPDDPNDPNNPDNPDYPGPSDADNDPYLTYDNNKIYDGIPFEDPKFTPLLNGNHDVKYYEWDYYIKNRDNLDPAHAITNPIDAARYVFVFTVDSTSQINPGKVYQQAFRIYPRPVQVEWGNTSFTYQEGVTHVPTATYKDVHDQVITCTVKDPQESKGTFDAVASTTDTNYSLQNPSTKFTIAANLIKDVVLKPDQHIEFGKPIIIEDVDGNIYIRKEDYDKDPTIVTDPDHTLLIDPDGNLLKYDKDKGEWVDADLPYTMTIEPNEDANEHKVTISLKNPLDNAWENHGTDDIVEIFTVDPIKLPNDQYELVYEYEELWVYTGNPIEPSPFNVYIRDVNTKEMKLIDPEDYTLSYNNNIEVTTEDNKAEIIIKANGNYVIDDIQYFTITASKPDVLELKDDALIQFITASYDPVDGAQIVEDGTVEHIKADEEHLFLGHLYQRTPIRNVLAQFKNDPTKLVVKDSKGNVMEEETYDEFFFGSGFTISLLDDNDQEIDKIQGILYGDLNGDGMINSADIVEAQTFIEYMTFDDVEEYYYYTGVVDRKTPTFNPTTIVAIQTFTEYASTDSSVDFNAFDGKYPQIYGGTASSIDAVPTIYKPED